MLYYAWRHPVFGFSLWLRLSARRGWAWPLCRLMHRRYVRRYGLQIYPSTRIGYGLYNLMTPDNINNYFTRFCAASVIVAVPIVALYIGLQRFFVAGIAAGAVKG